MIVSSGSAPTERNGLGAAGSAVPARVHNRPSGFYAGDDSTARAARGAKVTAGEGP